MNDFYSDVEEMIVIENLSDSQLEEIQRKVKTEKANRKSAAHLDKVAESAKMFLSKTDLMERELAFDELRNVIENYRF